MSRIGKQVIAIPKGVEITQNGTTFTVKGPLGSLTREFLTDIAITMADGSVTLLPKRENKFLKSLWGTYSSHIQNMIEGVTKGFEKKMAIEGVGFKVNLAGNTLVLDLGFSHQVKLEIPQGIKMTVEKNNFSVAGIDKDAVGEFAAKIRSHKKTEPYKGKGIRYVGEFIRRKQGKKSA
ncbi:MAG TPA: 50S ribosomal protein L6 [Candidatus Paceibacterota bacterium]|nr:50S ribosomal protein L6 [Candidatus Paceibacterota bacterium]